MSALIKLSLTSRQANYLHLDAVEGVAPRATASTLGIELVGTPQVIQMGGEKDGQVIEGTVVKANQRVRIRLGSISPHKFNTLVVFTPALMQYGTAQGPSFLEPGDKEELVIYFRADRQVDLAEFPWLVRIYMID
jgi:hypothetical protein